MRYIMRLITLLLVSLACANNLHAQSKNQQDSLDTRSANRAFVSEQIVLETPTATLYGTLERPQSPAPVPVVLLIAGSGPTDRDGNSAALSGPNNSLKLLAEGFTAHGIASVRYDKRGIGESGKAMFLAAQKANTKLREEDLLFNAYIDDAVLWGKKLRGDPRFSTITVVGHSEGSLIGMVAARMMESDAFVSIAGAGRPIQQIILEQVKGQLPSDLLKQTEEILNSLAAGQTVASVPSALHFLFRPSIQPYFISWLRYDPAKEIARLSVPVLILQGTTDFQTSVQDAKSLAGANPSAKLLLIEGMNHVLKTVAGEREKQAASYTDPLLPVSPRLIGEISTFVNNVKAQGRARQ